MEESVELNNEDELVLIVKRRGKQVRNTRTKAKTKRIYRPYIRESCDPLSHEISRAGSEGFSMVVRSPCIVSPKLYADDWHDFELQLRYWYMLPTLAANFRCGSCHRLTKGWALR